MRLTSSFLRHHPAASQPAARLERVLAVGRAFLTITGLAAIYLDPTEPARLREMTYGVLLAYAAYSLAALLFVHRAPRITPGHSRTLHGLDIIWTSALTFVSEGPISPFFLFFLFVIVSAAYRWGFRGTVATAAISILIFLAESVAAAAGPWAGTSLTPDDFQLDRSIIRLAYLLLTGVLLGYLAEQEKQSRAELGAIAEATRQPRVDRGLGGSIAAVAQGLLGTFGAAAVDVVLSDRTARRATLWQLDRSPPGSGRPRRVELDADQQQFWLFPDAARVWHALRNGSNGGSTVWMTEPDVWPLTRAAFDLRPSVLPGRSFRTVTAVNLEFPDEWQGRVYLFDMAETRGLERPLHFLESLADHIAPSLANVLLLRRLRERAGAAERARVARELHDGAIQALFGIEMKIEAIRRRLERPTLELDADLTDVQEVIRREALALRELMQALRPVEMDSSDQLPDVLATLVERFRRDTGISARFAAQGDRIDISAATAVEIVRIVQEALVNVRKHSRARNVLVRLTGTRAGCRVVVEDDGRGFEFEGKLTAEELDARRLGPVVILERARIAGAQLAVDSTPGTGARVELAFEEGSHV